MSAAIQVKGPLQETVREAKQALLAILDAQACDQVKLAAIQAFERICQTNVSVNNCNIDMSTKR